MREFQCLQEDLDARGVVRVLMHEDITTLQTCLVQRLHKECSMESFIASYEATQCWDGAVPVIGMLEGVIVDAHRKLHYDISGRAFMLMSEFLYRLAAVTNDEKVTTKEPSSDVNLWQEKISQSPATIEDILETLQLCSSTLTSNSSRKVNLATFAQVFERYASTMTKLCVSYPSPAKFCRIFPAYRDTWVVASAPARIDLSGAWSDTPPICVEHGGAVCGIAVTVDGLKPLSCRCRLVTGGSGVIVRGEVRDGRTGRRLSDEMSAVIKKVGDLQEYNDPKASCSLVKCALVYLGLVSVDDVEDEEANDISSYLQSFCGADENVGLEVVSTSLLPHGSGMGTSSILGGCILASIAKCVGFDMRDLDLIHGVSMLEQLLSTAGGWQDQVGGLFGGAKLGTSANTLPLKTEVEHISLSPQMEEELNRRLVLVFTGQTRLAKDILQNVLRRWARRSNEIVETVDELMATAYRARDCLMRDDTMGLADCLHENWTQKKVMTGESGEPPIVQEALKELLTRDIILAGSLCGAGGGGFLVLILQEGSSVGDVTRVCDQLGGEATDFTYHECKISRNGLSTFISPEQDFDLLSWYVHESSSLTSNKNQPDQINCKLSRAFSGGSTVPSPGRSK